MRCISLIATNTSIAFAEQIEKANLSWTMGNYLSVPEVDGIYMKSIGTSLIRVSPAKILRIAKEKKAQMGSTGWVNLSALWLILYSEKPSRKPDLEFR